MIIGLVGLHGATSASAAIVGHWQLNETSGTTASDVSGNANTGTLGGGPVWTTGKVGGGLSFDGIDDLVNCGTGSSLDNLGPITVAAWTNATDMGEGGYGRIVQKGTGVSAGWRFLVYGTNQIQFAVDHSTTDLLRGTAANAIATGAWYHVVATWTGSGTAATNVKIYVNGSEVSTYATTTDGVGTRGDDAATNLYLGNEGGGTRTFKGALDDVRVYNSVLSAAEIQALYQAGMSAPVGYWELNATSGTTASDSSGNSNTGTLTGGPVWTTGKIGNALSFDGIDDIVNCGSKVSLDNLPAVSVCAWIKATDMGEGGLGRIVQKNTGTNPAAGWRLLVYGTNQVQFAVDYATTDLVRGTGTNAIATGSWYHVAATWTGAATGTGAKIYVNGAEVASYATTTDGVGARGDDSAGSFYIGNEGGGARTFKGLIDDVQVYPVVLSASQIQAIYAEGGDSVAPTVSITAPAAGATVSGSTSVAASASDNIGVVGVQFKLDGANLGAEDIISPYSVSWDTTTASNGSHTLTAVARDAAGNTTTSTAVNVTVSNGGVGGGTLVYQWSPLASWIDGVPLANRDSDNVLELTRWTNSSAATVGSSLPIALKNNGGQQRIAFNRAPTGHPSLEINSRNGEFNPCNIELQLYPYFNSNPRHLRVVMEVKTCKSGDATTYKGQGLGTTGGAYPNWSATYAGTSGKYFIGAYAGNKPVGGGNNNWWNDSTLPINRAGYRWSFGTFNIYSYNFDRPNRYGGSQNDYTTTVGAATTGVHGVWHRIEIEVKLTTPSTVPENARRKEPEVEPTHQGDGYVKHFLTKDIDGALGAPGARTEVAAATGLIFFPKYDDVGTNDNMHTLANLAGAWFYLAYGGSVPAAAEGWAWIRKLQVYRHD